MRDEPPPPGGLPDSVLGRYAAGASDGKERARVEAWAAASDERRAYLVALRRSWARGRSGVPDAQLRETNAAWAALRPRLGEPVASRHAGEPTGASPPRERLARPVIRIPGATRATRATRSRVLLRGAAALVIAAGASGAMYLANSAASPTVVAVNRSPMREVVTGVGERARIRLGDGSTIVLAARSQLGIPADFGVHARELEAEGEAYFVVAHDSTRPFIVHARGARTVDLGTTFVLRAYPEDSHVSVVVAEGSVALGGDLPGDSTPTILRRGQMGRLRAGDVAPVVTTVDPARYTGWMEDRLSFDNAPLSEVISELARWHHAEIVLSDSSLARETVTATLTADSFDDALQTLTTVLSLRAERHGARVVLYRRGGKR